MAEQSLRVRAARQAVGLVAVLAAMGTGAYAFGQHADDPMALKADVSALRLQAAETLLLAEEALTVPPAFTQEHAQQLGRDIADQQQHIAALRVRSDLSGAHDAARDAAARLQEIITPLAQGALATTETGAIAGQLARTFGTLEDALRR